MSIVALDIEQKQAPVDPANPQHNERLFWNEVNSMVLKQNEVIPVVNFLSGNTNEVVELTHDNSIINAEEQSNQFFIKANGNDFFLDITGLQQGKSWTGLINHYQDEDGVYLLKLRDVTLPISQLSYTEKNDIPISGASAITIYWDGFKLNIQVEVTEKWIGPVITKEGLEPEIGVVGEVPFVAFELEAFGFVDAVWYNQEGITKNKTLGVVLFGETIIPGSWQCKLTDKYGNIKWSKSVLVRLAPKLAVTITNQPVVSDNEPPINTGVDFTGLTYTGNPPPTKQWKYDVNSGSEILISGATSDTLIGWVPPEPPGIDPLTVRVWCSLNNNFGEPVDTNKITLNVVKHAVVITTQPVLSSNNISAGSSVSVTAFEYTASPLGTIVWMFNNITSGTTNNVIAGETGRGITSWTPPLPTNNNPMELQLFATINNGVGSPVMTDMLSLNTEKATQPAPVTSFEGVESGQVVYRTLVVSGRTLEYSNDYDTSATWQDVTTFENSNTVAVLKFNTGETQAQFAIRFKGTATRKPGVITQFSQDYILLEDIDNWLNPYQYGGTNTNSPVALDYGAASTSAIQMSADTMIYCTLNQAAATEGGANGIVSSGFIGVSPGTGRENAFSTLSYCFGIYTGIPKMYQLGVESVLSGPVVGDTLRFPGLGNVQYSYDNGATWQNVLVSGSPVSINCVDMYVKINSFATNWNLYNIRKSIG